MSPVTRRILVLSAVLLGLFVAPARAGEITVEGVVGEALGMLQPVVAQRDLHVAVPAEGATRVVGDARRARDRVLNLLANALAFAPNGARIEVRVEKQSLVVRVSNASSVVDTDRSLRDSAGNEFRLRTVTGVGSELTARINEGRPSPLTVAEVER